MANLGGDFVIVRADGSPLYHFTVVVDDAAMGITRRDPRRGPPVEHAEAHPPVPGARSRAAALRPPAADPQPGPLEDEQAQEPDRAERLPRPGLHPRGARQLPRAPRLGNGHRGGDPRTRRDRRAVRHRRGPQGRRRVRPRAARVAQRPVDPAPVAGRAHRPSAPLRGRGIRCRPRRSDAVRRGARSAPAGRPRPAADARRDRRPGGVPVGGPPRGRPGAPRPEALGRRDDPSRHLPRPPRRSPRSRPSCSRPTSSSRRSARLAEGRGWKAGDLFMAIRVAVTGRTATPPLFDTLVALGRERTLERLRAAIDVLERSPATVDGT